MDRVETIINQLGGNTAVGRHLGVGHTTVSEFKRRNSIPPRYWKRLIELGVSAEALIEAHAKEPPADH